MNARIQCRKHPRAEVFEDTYKGGPAVRCEDCETILYRPFGDGS